MISINFLFLSFKKKGRLALGVFRAFLCQFRAMSRYIEGLATALQLYLGDTNSELDEFLKEASRNIMESVAHDEIDLSSWQLFLTSCGRASLSRSYGLPVGHFHDVTHKSLAPSQGTHSISAISQHRMAKCLRSELSTMGPELQKMISSGCFADYLSVLEQILSDVTKIQQAIGWSARPLRSKKKAAERPLWLHVFHFPRLHLFHFFNFSCSSWSFIFSS